MRLFAGKFLHLILVLLAVTAFTFAMLDILPVDIAHDIVGQRATAGEIAAIRARFGLDAPVAARYGRWLTGAVQGNLGRSFSTDLPVAAALKSHLPVTLELLFLAQLVALVIALPAGIVSAWWAGSWIDRLLGGLGFALASIPPFALAVVLIFVCSLRLKWFPATGYTPIGEGLWPNLKGLVLPTLSIALAEWISLARVLRRDLMATLQEDFILLARAKGLPAWRVLLGHALRPSCFSLVTLVGIHAGTLIGGAVIVENLFALPGIGRLLLTAVFSQDYPTVQGCVLWITVGYVGINFLVDLGYALLDPRLRRGGYRA